MKQLSSHTWTRLAAVLLLALGLRLINLGGRTLWYDEAFAVLFAETGWDAMIDGTLTQDEGGAAEEHPLLYYQSLYYWMDIFGQSVAAVRLYSALLGVLTVGAVFVLARDWFGEQTALAAALITAIAPFHVQYTQETRMYALMALSLTLATWVYWRAWQRDRIGYWIAFGVLAGVSMYVQQLAAMSLLALGLLPFVLRDRRRIVRTVAASLLALAIYLPWMLNLPDQLAKLRQYWVAKPNILHLWLALRSFVSVNLDFAPGWWLPTFLLAAILTVFVLYRGYTMLRDQQVNAEDKLPVQWVLWLAFMPMVLTWIVSYIFQPVFLPRTLLPSAVMFYIALAWLFTHADLPRLIVIVLSVSWGVIMVFGLVTHYTWDTFPTPPFDDAVGYLDDQYAPDDVIVHGNKITMLPMVYYGRDVSHDALAQRYVRDIPGSGSDTLAVPTQEMLGLLADECIAVAAGGAARVWYVTFEQLEEEMIELVEDDPDNAQYDSLRWLRAHYMEAAVRSFSDLNVYLFTTPDDVARQALCESTIDE
ncbi:MAG: glycosyltransferase family 39 protein [Anaerolineae bacterium]|nr:glycosyltransferase family 39 protein [Anaerolineae bacterium]